MAYLFCAVNITGDIRNFRKISILFLLNKTKIVEILTYLKDQRRPSGLPYIFTIFDISKICGKDLISLFLLLYLRNWHNLFVKYVVTAAHCTYNKKIEQLRIGVSLEYNIREEIKQIIVKNIVYMYFFNAHLTFACMRCFQAFFK